MNTLKEAASSLEFDYLEAMENRIRDAARLPSALLPQVARLLAALPPERLPENLKWRQIEGSHYSASVLDLDIQPDVPWLKELRGPDPAHDQTVTAAHGATWNACYGILSEGLIRPQAAKSDSYPPFGFFCKGTTEAFTQFTADKALDAVARKAKAQSLALLVEAKVFSCHSLEGGIAKLQAAVRRDYASKSASDRSVCIRSEFGRIRGVAFYWPR